MALIPYFDSSVTQHSHAPRERLERVRTKSQVGCSHLVSGNLNVLSGESRCSEAHGYPCDPARIAVRSQLDQATAHDTERAQALIELPGKSDSPRDLVIDVHRSSVSRGTGIAERLIPCRGERKRAYELCARRLGKAVVRQLVPAIPTSDRPAHQGGPILLNYHLPGVVAAFEANHDIHSRLARRHRAPLAGGVQLRARFYALVNVQIMGSVNPADGSFQGFR